MTSEDFLLFVAPLLVVVIALAFLFGWGAWGGKKHRLESERPSSDASSDGR